MWLKKKKKKAENSCWQKLEKQFDSTIALGAEWLTPWAIPVIQIMPRLTKTLSTEEVELEIFRATMRIKNTRWKRLAKEGCAAHEVHQWPLSSLLYLCIQQKACNHWLSILTQVIRTSILAVILIKVQQPHNVNLKRNSLKEWVLMCPWYTYLNYEWKKEEN